MRNLLAVLLILALAGGWWYFARQPGIQPEASGSDASIRLNRRDDPEILAPRYVFDVMIHRRDEMQRLLERIDQLAARHATTPDAPQLALVLHGPEIDYFTRRNYAQYRDIVDRAADLDKKGILDVKVCDTMIRELGLENEPLPAFIEHVPFGPAEVDRLVGQGYVKM